MGIEPIVEFSLTSLLKALRLYAEVINPLIKNFWGSSVLLIRQNPRVFSHCQLFESLSFPTFVIKQSP
jgi:hypothetical protein